MPELGETWSMNTTLVAATGASERLEAIILATGPSRIRLVTRAGRRITAPLSSWDHVWHFVRAAPSTRRNCERDGCTQEAYFRYYLGKAELHWACEDHLPHGITAQFPGDPDDPTDRSLSCVFCGSTVTQGAVLRHYEWTSVSHRCSGCHAQWYPLISRGLGDDGTILAQDIHGLKTLTSIAFLEVRMGYRSYRDLCRALGVGSTQHIGGLPIIHDPRLEDQLTLAMEGTALPYDAHATPTSRPPAASGSCQPPEASCAEGETWAHRDNDGLLITIVKVHSLGHTVTIEEAQYPHRREMNVLDLLHYYRRLRIRTYWEILESEEDDALDVEQPYP